jgi:hypothetical protein
MANPTLAELRSLVQGYMFETRGSANSQFPDADINAELNNAAREAILTAGNGIYMTRPAVANIVTGWVAIPTDALGQIRFSIVTSGAERDLDVTTAEQMDRDFPDWRDQTATYPTHIVVQFDETSGFQYWAHPQPDATITSGLGRRYAKNLTEVTLDAGTFALIAPFPTLQRILLPAGALKNLLLLEGGEADDQVMKWEAIFRRSCTQLRNLTETMFATNSTYGRR